MATNAAPPETELSTTTVADQGRLLTLGELAKLAEAVTSQVDIAPRSKRIHAVPDERMIRYYTTKGIIDKPSRSKDRTARYGSRHLAQLLAAKRLQFRGQTLDSIAQSLTALSTDELYAIADMPQSAIPSDLAPGAQPPARQAREFWSAQPTTRAALTLSASSLSPTQPSLDPTDVTAAAPVFKTHHTLQLAPNLTLVITGPAPDPQLTASIAALTAPLVALLATTTPPSYPTTTESRQTS
jgi:DNA-binding transcriptional MerR regulator